MPTFIPAVLSLLCIGWTNAAAAKLVTDGNGSPELKVLFVGNSLLYFNGGVYKVVAGLLHDRFPNVTIQADQVAAPNFLFQQHLEKALTPGTAQAETLGPNSTVHWDYVLFQEESQQVALGGDPDRQSLAALKQLARLAAARGAQVGVDLTWAWLDGKNPAFPSFRDMQGKVNAGYAANLKEMAAEGIPAFLAASGLGWQVVDDLVDAAKSGKTAASSLAAAAPAPAAVPLQAAIQEEGPAETMLMQSRAAGQDAAMSPSALPPANAEASLQVASPTTQICEQGAAVEGEASPAEAPTIAPAAAQSGAPEAAPRAEQPAAKSGARAPPPAGLAGAAATAPAAKRSRVADTALQLPARAEIAPAASMPATLASVAWVQGRRLLDAKPRPATGFRAAAEQGLSGLAEPVSAAGAAVRRLMQVQQAVAFLYGSGPGSSLGAASERLILAPEPSRAPAQPPVLSVAPAAPSYASEPAKLRQPPAPAAAPAGAAAGAAADVPVQAPASSKTEAAEAPAPELASAEAASRLPEQAPGPSEPELNEGNPSSDHETVIEQGQQAYTPAPSQGAAVKGLTGGLCSPVSLPAGSDTFKEMYASDGNHPSPAGTYLQGLIIASSMTGCRMKGNGFTFELEPQWSTFLQELSDAIVFKGTPAQFPPYPWSAAGPKCTLKP